MAKVKVRQLNLTPNLDELTLGTLMDLESGDLTQMVTALATMVVGADGEPVTDEEGMEYLRGLKVNEIEVISETVIEAIEDGKPKKKKLTRSG